MPAMETFRGMTLAEQLSRVPVRTDADVLARVAAVICPAARAARALWLMFVNPDGTQPNLIMPMDDVPESPDAEDGEVLFQMLSQVFGPDGADCSIIITLARGGAADLGDGDRQWLRVLQWGIAEYAAPVRMLCLATPAGVRELGPVAA
jgi:hypothetical protein